MNQHSLYTQLLQTKNVSIDCYRGPQNIKMVLGKKDYISYLLYWCKRGVFHMLKAPWTLWVSIGGLILVFYFIFYFRRSQLNWLEYGYIHKNKKVLFSMCFFHANMPIEIEWEQRRGSFHSSLLGKNEQLLLLAFAGCFFTHSAH